MLYTKSQTIQWICDIIKCPQENGFTWTSNCSYKEPLHVSKNHSDLKWKQIGLRLAKKNNKAMLHTLINLYAEHIMREAGLEENHKGYIGENEGYENMKDSYLQCW